MKISPRERGTLLIGAVALAAILALRFLIFPWVDSWTDARQQIADCRKQVDEEKARMVRAMNQRKRLEGRYGPAVGKPLAESTIAKEDLFNAAQKALKANGFQVGGYEPQRPRPAGKIAGVEWLSLQVRGKCPEAQLSKCLAELRNADTLLIVERLSVTGDEKNPGNLDVTLLLATLAEQAKQAKQERAGS
jgi:hypothetical protein